MKIKLLSIIKASASGFCFPLPFVLLIVLSSTCFINKAQADFYPPCTNLLENPGFEFDLDAWTATGGAVNITNDALTGNNAASICGDGYGTLGQILPTSPGMEYKATIRGKVEGEPGGLFTVRFLDDGYTPIPLQGQSLNLGTIRSSSYFEEEVFGTAPMGAVYVHLLFWKEDEGCFFIDDLELCEGIPLPDTWTSIACPYDILVEAEPGLNGAVVEYTGLGSSTVTACLPQTGITQTEGLPTNSFFPLGTTLNCFSYTNSCGDTDECCFNVIVESVVETLPDLSIDIDYVSPDLERGKIVNFSYDITNEFIPFEGYFSMVVWLSQDETIQAPNDILIEYVEFEDIGVEVFSNLTGSFAIPADYPLGAANILFQINGNNLVAEIDESNNKVVQPVTIMENSGAPCSYNFANGKIDCTEYLPDGTFRVVTNENNLLTENIIDENGTIAFTQDLGPAEIFTFSTENGQLIKKDFNDNIIFEVSLSVDFQNYGTIEDVIEFDNGYVFAAYLPFTNLEDKVLAIIKTDNNTNVLTVKEYPSPFGFFHNLERINDERFVAIYNENTGYQGSNKATLVILDSDLEERWTKVISQLYGSVSQAVVASFRKTVCGTFFYKSSGGSGGGGGGFLFNKSFSDGYYIYEGDSLRFSKVFGTSSLNTGFGGTSYITTTESFSGYAADGGLLYANESYFLSNAVPPLFNYVASHDTLFLKKEINGTEVWSAFKVPFSIYPFRELAEIGGRYFLLNENLDDNEVSLTLIDDCDNNGAGGEDGPLPDLIITEAIVPDQIINNAPIVDVTLTVKNVGLGVFKGTYIDARVMINNTPITSIGTPVFPDSIILAPGESITFTELKNLVWWPGDNEVGFAVDHYELIHESNDQNNFYSVPITNIESLGNVPVDLELSLEQTIENPDQWSEYAVVATLTNVGVETATDVVVAFPKPDGVVYVGSNQFNLSQGTFSVYGDQTWSLSDLTPGSTATLTVNYFLLENEATIAYAQVQSLNEVDVDSTPGNGTPPVPNEDDEASTSDGPIDLMPDLELEIIVDVPGNQITGVNVNVDLSLKNNGNSAATGVEVQINELVGPINDAYVDFISQGSFDEATNTWTVGTVNPGESINLELDFSMGINNEDLFLFAEVTNQNETDSDSSPGNGNGTTVQEDDEALAPGRDCNISFEILNYTCSPALFGSNQLDLFTYDILVENAPNGWTIGYGLYSSPNNTGDGDGLFTIGPVERYALETGMDIYDRGIPFCSAGPTNGYSTFCDPGSLPDLTITDFNVSSYTVNTGAVLDYTFDLLNIGNGNAGDDFNVRAYISTDDIWSAFEDELVDDIPTGNFEAGFSVNDVNGAASIPSDIPAGDYYLFLVADAFNDFNESNESNNIVSVIISVMEGSSSPCDDVTVETGPGSITISNTNAAHVLKKIFDPNWNTVLDCLDANCTNPSVVSGLPGGAYYVTVKLMDANWQTICDFEEYINIPASSNTGFSQQELPSRPIQLRAIIPNPTMNGRIEVMIFSKVEGFYNLQCYSALGGLENTFDIKLSEGWNKIPLDVSKLTAGTYHLHMPGQNWRQMPVQFVVVRD